eukprot:COSAG04_NODE_1505_length_6506_cov_4.798335_5_plen_972_part_00
MLGLMCFLLAATTVAAGLPTRKQPTHPWEAAEPPTAESLRQLQHKMMLPQSTGDEPASEAETAASFEAFLRARGGRLEPMWANHSHAERTANLLVHHASRRNERRRAQAFAGANLFADATAEEKDSSIVAVLDPPPSTCDDPLATNTDQPTPCTYDCADLQREYFPEPQSQTTRCFLFDPSTETWPEVGGEGAELLSMREQRFETHTYISVEDGTNPSPSGLSFTMGEGRVCRDVTIKTFMGMESHEETVCLVDGEHEYNHTVTEEHSVEVVGYAESGVHDGAGGTTSFVIGTCTDALIRVTTTSAGGGSMTWSLDDGGHNGPWTFETSGAMGVEEQESCMYDNDFALTLQGGGGLGWEGSVEVAGFIHYHNTITIPNDENWIVQGIVDPVSGLPSSLDGRLKSGSAVDRSHANIVLRHLRISGQVAPMDVNPLSRTGMNTGLPTFGGAFEYDGGSADPDDLAKLVFIEVVFDHNAAPGGSGGAIFIDGRAAMPSLDPAVQIWESGIALTISACTFFRNFAGWTAGAVHVQDVFPLDAVIDGSTVLHNDASQCQHELFNWAPNIGPALRSGVASVSSTGNRYDGGSASGIFPFFGASFVRVDGAGLDEPDAHWSATHEGCSWVNHAAEFSTLTVFLGIYPVLADKQLRTEWKFVDSVVSDAVTLSSMGEWSSCAFVVAQGSVLVERSRFEKSGSFDPATTGYGGASHSLVPPGGSIVPDIEFRGSDWIDNASGNGPAYYVSFVRALPLMTLTEYGSDGSAYRTSIRECSLCCGASAGQFQPAIHSVHVSAKPRVPGWRSYPRSGSGALSAAGRSERLRLKCRANANGRRWWRYRCDTAREHRRVRHRRYQRVLRADLAHRRRTCVRHPQRAVPAGLATQNVARLGYCPHRPPALVAGSAVRQRLVRRARQDLQPRRQPGGRTTHAVDRVADDERDREPWVAASVDRARGHHRSAISLSAGDAGRAVSGLRI